MEDESLATAAAAGDREAFAALAERYRAYVYRIAWKIALNEDDALDIAQEVFAKLLGAMGQFNGKGPFRAWLGAISARAALDHRRRPARRERAFAPEEMERIAEARRGGGPARDGPREALEREQQRGRVEQAMASLSPQQRAIFALRLGEDMGPTEIAGRLGIPAKQVRVQLHRAIARLREMMEEK